MRKNQSFWGVVYIVCAVTFILFLTGAGISAQEEKIKKVNYVFIIDVSGSMLGKGDGDPAVIFPEVKNFLRVYIDQIEPGSNLFIYPFDSRIHDQKKWENIQSQRSHIHQYIDNLDAAGNRTYIYESLKNIFLQMREFIGEHNEIYEYTNIIYLFTDGLDTSPSRMTLADALEYFRLAFDGNVWERKDDWLYFVTLDVKHFPEEDREILEATEGAQYVLNPRDSVKVPIIVKPKLQHLLFSNLELGSPIKSVQGFEIRGVGEPPMLRAELMLDLPNNSYFSFDLETREFRADSHIELILRPFPDMETVQRYLQQATIKGYVELSPLSKDDMVSIIPSHRIALTIPNCATGVYVKMNDKRAADQILELGSIDVRTADTPRIAVPFVFTIDQGYCDLPGAVNMKAEAFGEEHRAVPIQPFFEGANKAVASFGIGEFGSQEQVTRTVVIPWENIDWEGDFKIRVEFSSREFNIDKMSWLIRGRLERSYPPYIKLLIILIIVALLALLTLIGTQLFLGCGMAAAAAYWLAMFGLKKARLSGRLERHFPGRELRHLDINGMERILIGPKGEHWPDIPMTIEVAARYVHGRSQAYVLLRGGSAMKKSLGRGQPSMLDPGRSHKFEFDDTILLGENEKIIYRK